LNGPRLKILRPGDDLGGLNRLQWLFGRVRLFSGRRRGRAQL